jgi:TetR/AcrR family transcriptional regulator
MSDEKKKRIMAAAIKEFAQKGYDKASTNTITAEAGIAKGSLFHYFGSKKKLFLWLVQYALGIALEHYQKDLPQLSPDFADRLMERGMEKLKFYRQHPELSQFVTAAFIDPPKEIASEIKALEQELRAQNSALVMKDLDMSGLRDDVDKQKAMQLMTICLEGLGNKYREKYRNQPEKIVDDFDEIISEMKEYVELLKYGTYKKN